MECGNFANLQANYFGLPERGRLFKHRFGFKSWDLAMEFFEIAFPEFGKDARKKSKAILHPRFQFLAALWRMKRAVSVEELAAFFGVTRQNMASAPAPRPLCEL